MKALYAFLAIVVIAGGALAGEPPYDDVTIHDRVPCGLVCIVHEWDFAVTDWGFTTAICEAGGVSTWQYGVSPFGTLWGTTLAGAYPNNAGDGLISPPFTVTEDAHLMEVYHYYDIESNFDGGNVMVNGTVVAPIGGYDGTISTSASYYAYCVDMEQGFTSFGGWGTDCWTSRTSWARRSWSSSISGVTAASLMTAGTSAPS